jgi:hypothetical protein
MAAVPIVPGRTEVQLKASGRGHKVPPLLAEMPGGLFPLKSAAFVVDEYRIMAGWPVPVPDCDIRAVCLVNAEGNLLGNRDSPLGLTTAATGRWVADSNFYDETSFQWTPLQGDVSPWLTSTDHAPTLVTDYEYRNGNERFLEMTALNFDSNTADYMWNDMGLILGGTSGYTVIMVVSPNSIYGNDPQIVSHGLWGPNPGAALWDPAHKPTGSAWVAFTLENKAVYLTTESHDQQKGVAFGNALAGTAPSYLALVVNRPPDPAGRPMVTTYACSGASNVVTKALVAQGAPGPLSTDFWLGKGAFSNQGTVDMALFDLSIYANPLSAAQVVAEITKLSTVYGGDG